jgi:hypothetical protein
MFGLTNASGLHATPWAWAMFVGRYSGMPYSWPLDSGWHDSDACFFSAADRAWRTESKQSLRPFASTLLGVQLDVGTGRVYMTADGAMLDQSNFFGETTHMGMLYRAREGTSFILKRMRERTLVVAVRSTYPVFVRLVPNWGGA